jgi:hypothetical protein
MSGVATRDDVVEVLVLRLDHLIRRLTPEFEVTHST